MRFDICLAIFRVICVACTGSMIVFWIYKYSLNLDLCLVDFKAYFETEDDVYPLLSLCFREPFVIAKLKEYGPDVDSNSYLEYLKGQNFTLNSKNISYDKVTINLNNYTTGYYIQWTNGSYAYYPNNDNKQLLDVSFNGFWFDVFYKCFSIDMPLDKNTQGFAVKFRNDIFEPGIKIFLNNT